MDGNNPCHGTLTNHIRGAIYNLFVLMYKMKSEGVSLAGLGDNGKSCH